MALQKVPIDFKISQMKCPLQNEKGLALSTFSKMKLQACMAINICNLQSSVEVEVKEHKTFKIVTHVYKMLHTQSPSYLVELVHSYNSNTAECIQATTPLISAHQLIRPGFLFLELEGRVGWLPRVYGMRFPAGLREAISLPVVLFKSLLKPHFCSPTHHSLFAFLCCPCLI